MSQYFFNRVAALTIGKPNTLGGLDVGIKIQTPLRIAFEITKAEFSMGNIGKITVNNLSDATRKIIRQDRGLIAILEAGYADAGGPQLIFSGDIWDVSHNVEKPEVETTITVIDGHNAIKQKKIAISYAKDTPIAKIIQDAAKSLGLPIDATFNYLQLPTANLDGTLAFTGPAATWLTKLCDDNGLQWSVQNGSVKICALTQTDNLPPLSSFLIGSPKRLFKNELSASLNDFSGYEFKALLMPKCAPYSRVTIQSRELPTPVTLRVAEVKHTGDSHGAEWSTTVRARDL